MACSALQRKHADGRQAFSRGRRAMAAFCALANATVSRRRLEGGTETLVKTRYRAWRTAAIRRRGGFE